MLRLESWFARMYGWIKSSGFYNNRSVIWNKCNVKLLVKKQFRFRDPVKDREPAEKQRPTADQGQGWPERGGPGKRRSRHTQRFRSVRFLRNWCMICTFWWRKDLNNNKCYHLLRLIYLTVVVRHQVGSAFLRGDEIVDCLVDCFKAAVR